MAKKFKKDIPSYFDYRDVKTLQKFVNIYGQIETAKTINSSYQKSSTSSITSFRS